MTRDEDMVRWIMKRKKVDRARAEKIYDQREARHGDFQWYKVEIPDETKAPKPDEG